MASSFTIKLQSFNRVIKHLEYTGMHTDVPDEFWIPTAIAYFKLCFELAWKTMKKDMQDRGIDAAITGSPETF